MNNNISRAEFLKKTGRWAVAGMAGSAIPPLVSAEENISINSPVKSVIFLNMAGGMSHVDTFDPKPGICQFPLVNSSIKGINIASCFNKTAKQLHQVSLVRSLFSKTGDHRSASRLLHTGHGRNNGFPDIPSIGAVIASAKDKKGAYFPGHITMGGRSEIIGAPGFLGSRFASFHISDASRPLGSMRPGRGISDARLYRREELLSGLNRGFAEKVTGAKTDQWRQMRMAALDFMNSSRLKVFDLSLESEKARGLYGENRTGRALLLARRLAEAEVPFIEITIGGWDTHANNKERIKSITDELDPALASLLADLGESGLFKQTLFVMASEFGRTPAMASNGNGRDHHPRVFTGLIAGGPIQPGRVIGASDGKGMKPGSDPVSVPRFLATVYRASGVDPEASLENSFGRPFNLVEDPSTIKELLD